MSLNIAESYSDELKQSIEKVIHKHTDREEVFEVASALALYVVSNNLDVKSFFFDEQYEYLGSLTDKLRDTVNSTLDFLFLILDSRDFIGINLVALQSSLKEEVFNSMESKFKDKTIHKDNYSDFIDYFQSTYDIHILLDILRIRILDNHEKKEEYKAILEYMIFLGRNNIQESEFERLQHSINFRLNILKNYNIDYFCKNFFILKEQAKYLPKDLQENKYFYPNYLLKEMKNLILMLERGESHSLHIQHKARNVMRRQLRIIEENKKHITKLRPSVAESDGSNTASLDSSSKSESKPDSIKNN